LLRVGLRSASLVRASVLHGSSEAMGGASTRAPSGLIQSACPVTGFRSAVRQVCAATGAAPPAASVADPRPPTARAPRPARLPGQSEPHLLSHVSLLTGTLTANNTDFVQAAAATKIRVSPEPNPPPRVGDLAVAEMAAAPLSTRPPRRLRAYLASTVESLAWPQAGLS
jgi:hypothetical protein